MRMLIAVVIFFLASCAVDGGNHMNGSPHDLKDPYLGQEPPGLTPTAFAPGIVSTENLELSGAFSPDLREFYFNRQVEGDGIKTHVIRYENGAWQEPVIFDDSEGLFISPDGNTMHLGRTYRERTGLTWSETRTLGPQFNQFPIMRLTASAAGTYVFDEREEIGTLRYSRLIDGKHEEPKAFGEHINSGKWTAHPFIAPDESYLIWDSEREGGYGGTDLYISFRQEDGSWGAAINMGENINTEYEDSGGTVTPDGKYFFFDTVNLGQSFRESQANIYWVDAKVIESLRRRQQ